MILTVALQVDIRYTNIVGQQSNWARMAFKVCMLTILTVF